MADRTCAVPDCTKQPRSGSADLCPMHYHRWYRHGSVDLTAHEARISASHGRRYRWRYAPGHALASRANGKVYEHRMVLYDTIGPGPHACHWCKTQVDWLPKGEPAALQVDHLNGFGDDNHPDNLVPSCADCNIARAMQARADALRRAGWWANHDTIAGLKSGGRRPRVA